jgi:phosphoglycolate phosphatase-like HAD superfamily hydrolase
MRAFIACLTGHRHLDNLRTAMATDPQEKLRAHKPTREFFVGIDSDGCCFNSMEVKHNDSFSVNLIKYFGLQALSRQAHQAWDFVNLYSQTRGCNRFKAIPLALDQMREMPRVKKAGANIPELPYLKQWISSETALSNPRLKEKIAAASGAEKAELELVLEWSKAVNRTVEDIVHDLPPFPRVEDSLIKLRERADIMVVSATPQEALDREWAEHGIDGHVALIAGQEMGSKTEHLTLAAKGKYPSENILMIGDAPGDLKAGRDIGALFFPINPGDEEASWERFHDEAIDRFFARQYAGAYEAKLIEEFNRLLPKDPPWK